MNHARLLIAVTLITVTLVTERTGRTNTRTAPERFGIASILLGAHAQRFYAARRIFRPRESERVWEHRYV